MNTINDPLSVLFTEDAKAIDRQQLATIVSPYISIDPKPREFGILPAFSGINGNTRKVEILLAAAKARSLYLNETDGLLPSEIIAIGVIAPGSAKSSIKNLFDNHKIKKDQDGRYFLPSYRISELTKHLNNNS